MSNSPRRRPSRARSGRLLLEALIALTLSAIGLVAVADIANSALAMGDAAIEYDRALQSVEAGAADALRAPCSLAALAPVAPWSPRHITTRRATIGATPVDPSRLRTTDRWYTVGVGQHAIRASTAEIGVRCD